MSLTPSTYVWGQTLYLQGMVPPARKGAGAGGGPPADGEVSAGGHLHSSRWITPVRCSD